MTADPVQRPRTDDAAYDVRGDDGWVEFSVGEALAYGWSRFWTNALVWMGLVVGSVLALVAVGVVVGGFDLDGVRSFGWSGSYAPGAIGGLLLASLVSALAAAPMVRGALDETHGRKAAFRSVLRLGDVRAVLLACAVLAAGYTIGTQLLVLPGLVFAFLAYYTLPFVLDHGQDAIAGLRSSASFVAANLGRFLMLAVGVVCANLVGAMFFGIGLLVTVPATLIATMYAFRTLQGERVA